MAVEAELPGGLAAERERVLRQGIATEEGVEVFRRALASEPTLPQIVVSTRNFGSRLPLREGSAALAAESGPEPEPGLEGAHRNTRPENVSTPYVAPRNDAEKMASEIWQELMGIEPIGVDDNFFELGGHSLLGIQVLGRMNDAFAVRLSFQDLFAAPTVAGLSAKIAELSFEHEPDYAKIASLLDNLEQHSEEEIRKIVAESRAGGFRK